MRFILSTLLISCILIATVFAQYPPTVEERPNTVVQQLEFHTALAERLFNLISTFVNTNVNVLLWLKRSFISFMVRAFSYGSYFIANNQQFVSNQIDFISSILKSLVLNTPYFNVPNVARTAANSGPNEYGLPQSIEPSWLYGMPNILSAVLGSNLGNNVDRNDDN